MLLVERHVMKQLTYGPITGRWTILNQIELIFVVVLRQKLLIETLKFGFQLRNSKCHKYNSYRHVKHLCKMCRAGILSKFFFKYAYIIKSTSLIYGDHRSICGRHVKRNVLFLCDKTIWLYYQVRN